MYCVCTHPSLLHAFKGSGNIDQLTEILQLFDNLMKYKDISQKCSIKQVDAADFGDFYFDVAIQQRRSFLFRPLTNIHHWQHYQTLGKKDKKKWRIQIVVDGGDIVGMLSETALWWLCLVGGFPLIQKPKLGLQKANISGL
jgi:hypothetical protein